MTFEPFSIEKFYKGQTGRAQQDQETDTEPGTSGGKTFTVERELTTTFNVRGPLESSPSASPSLYLIAEQTAAYNLGEIPLTATDEQAMAVFARSLVKLSGLTEAPDAGPTYSSHVKKEMAKLLQGILADLAKQRADAAAKANEPDAGADSGSPA